MTKKVGDIEDEAVVASIRQRNVEYAKKYRLKNSEKIRRPIVCECGSTYAYYNSTQHARTKKHCQWMESHEMKKQIAELKKQLLSN